MPLIGAIIIGVLLFLVNVACVEHSLRNGSPLWVLNAGAALFVLIATCSLIFKS